MGSYIQRKHQTSCVSGWIKFALLGAVISILFQGAFCDVEPTESQCRTHIQKALKEHHLDADEKVLEDAAISQVHNEEEENPPTDEFADSTEGFVTKDDAGADEDDDDEKKEGNDQDNDDDADNNDEEDDKITQGEDDEAKTEEQDDEEGDDVDAESKEKGVENQNDDDAKGEVTERDDEDERKDIGDGADQGDDNIISEEPIEIEVQEVELDDDDDAVANNNEDKEEVVMGTMQGEETDEGDEGKTDADDEDDKEKDETVADEEDEDDKKKEEGTTIDISTEDQNEKGDEDENDKDETKKDNVEEEINEQDREAEEKEEAGEVEKEEEIEAEKEEEGEAEKEEGEAEKEEEVEAEKEEEGEVEKKEKDDVKDGDEDDDDDDRKEEEEKVLKRDVRDSGSENAAKGEAEDDSSTEEKGQEAPEEELIKEVMIPDNLRPRSHISKILKLEDSNLETILEKTMDTTLKALKGLYDNAIKPLEMLYKYRDLSNRHFGDPEIFSKPLILFMGPWSGGKSSTINYLLDNEFSRTALRTGAEPSPAYFNILMYGEEEILDGTQLAADWTFSGLQKFGQGLLDRLRGVKLPNKLLEKVNIVEIPGILEIRKQVQRLFPFNDACQWFIDRADIIFLVYDPSKLDVGPETEAILDQLKGREYQTRIILNKADQVKPEELMRVQGTLIWNISPLMSSSEPPIMYSTSLWSLPYETGAPIRLLQAQERAFLRDLKEAIDKRIENKIASARRFAVRVRNHAKMVDCYLTTYYNHKTIFGNRKKISDDIIEFPQKYHIYEGLSTLTNISRYDLPDPDVYRDFFKINPLYDFKKLSETCTYFRGCPINKLDVAIAYDLPELVGKYKKAVEAAKEELQKKNS